MNSQQNPGDLTDSLAKMNLDSTSRSLITGIPGQASRTQETTVELLKKNNRSFDIFFKKALHNHTAHHILAAYAFGASEERLNRIYEFYASYQTARLPPKLTITQENWTEHLGDDEYLLYLNNCLY